MEIAILPLGRTQINKNNLIDLFNIVAAAHHFDLSRTERERAYRFLTGQGFEELRTSGRLRYSDGAVSFNVEAQDSRSTISGPRPQKGIQDGVYQARQLQLIERIMRYAKQLQAQSSTR